jgi:hypothetical protein
MGEASPDNGIPRGALIVVAVGLVACVAAALLATDRSSGVAPHLEWVQERPLPDSRSVAVPGGDGERMLLSEADIRATGTNFAGFSLLRTSAVLRIDAGAPVGGGRIRCRTRAPRGFVAQTPGSRASYPRSSEKLDKQDEPEVVLVEYSSHGAGLAVLDFEDLFEGGFAPVEGIKLEWPVYREGDERWEWFLPPGPPEEELVLPFAAVWKTNAIPSARFACTLTVGAGTATVRTAGALPERSPPIDEEAEEIAQEEAREEEEEEEESAEASEEAE